MGNSVAKWLTLAHSTDGCSSPLLVGDIDYGSYYENLGLYQATSIASGFSLFLPARNEPIHSGQACVSSIGAPQRQQLAADTGIAVRSISHSTK